MYGMVWLLFSTNSKFQRTCHFPRRNLIIILIVVFPYFGDNTAQAQEQNKRNKMGDGGIERKLWFFPCSFSLWNTHIHTHEKATQKDFLWGLSRSQFCWMRKPKQLGNLVAIFIVHLYSILFPLSMNEANGLISIFCSWYSLFLSVSVIQCLRVA